MSIALEVTNLSTHYETPGGPIKAVDDVSFSLEKGQTLGLVGESGSGKSQIALSLMGLVDPPGTILPRSRILLDGTDLRGLSEAGLQRLRGEHISMVFQEPMTSLNPVRTVGSQVAEVLLAHEDQSDLTARARAVRMLERVGIPDPTGRFDDFPHQMSGGMRQRVMIAASLICSPRVLILDEPTTALDVTVQAQILDLVRDLQREFDMSILFITHDLGVIAEVADRIAVMYAGRIVEIGEAAPVLARPQHPYTEGLLRSAPRLGMHLGDVQILRGAMPNPLDLPSGCRFEPRCEYAFGRCAQEPPLIETETGCAACWLRDDRSKTTAPVVV